MDGLTMASLLCSRLCHDLISPVGAVNNGLELAAESRARATGPEMTLVNQSAEAASSALQFYRLAFGAMDERESINAAMVERIARAHLHRGRVTVSWRSMEEAILKLRARLTLNLMLCAVSALPRGGEVAAIIDPGVARIAVMARSETVDLAEDAAALMTTRNPVATTSRDTHLMIANLFARRLGSRIEIGAEPGAVTLTTRFSD